MDTTFKHIVKYLYINVLMQLRKSQESLGLSKLSLLVFTSLSMLFHVLLLTGLVLLLFWLRNLVGVTSYAFLQFILLVIFIEQIFWCFDFFNKNKHCFSWDRYLHIYQFKRVRWLRIYSNIIWKVILKVIKVWLPLFFLFTLKLQVYPLFSYFRGILIYTLITYSLVLLLVSIQFYFTHLWQKFSRIFSKTFLIIFNLVISLLLGYLSALIFINFQIREIFMRFIASGKLTLLNGFNPYVNEFNFLNWLGIGSASAFFLTIGLYKLFVYFDFLTIVRFEERKYSNCFAKVINKKVLHVKDLIFLKRLSGWFFDNVLTMLNLTLIVGGFFIGVTKYYFSSFPIESVVMSTILIAGYSYPLIGSSLKVILAIDGELKHLYLFLPNVDSMWEIYKGKIVLYIKLGTVYSIFSALLMWIIFQTNVYWLFVFFTIYFVNGVFIGGAQLVSTALYPKLNWESYSEIGTSKKATIYEYIHTGLVLALTLSVGTASLFVLRYTNYAIPIIMSIFCLLLYLLAFLHYFFIKQFLLKIKMSDKFCT